jgi:hypothetical protein
MVYDDTIPTAQSSIKRTAMVHNMALLLSYPRNQDPEIQMFPATSTTHRGVSKSYPQAKGARLVPRRLNP